MNFEDVLKQYEELEKQRDFQLEEEGPLADTPQIVGPPRSALMSQGSADADIKDALDFEDELDGELDNLENELEQEKIEEAPVAEKVEPQASAPSAKNYEELLNEVKPLTQTSIDEELKRAQEERRNTLMGSGILAGANMIAQGFAKKFGSDIGAGDEYAKEMAKNAGIGVEEILERKKADEVKLSQNMNDPNSDISNFTRQLAAEQMKKIDPEFDVNLFSKMSAAELDKLGFKSASSTSGSIRTPQQSDYETQDGEPLSFDPMSNSYVNILSGEKYSGPVRRKVINQFVDPRTGDIILRDRTNLMPIAPKSATASKAQTDAKITRKDLSPKEKELVDETRKAFSSDPRYKASQEAVDGSQNALSLLKSGQESGQDLVRAIQTMLAKSSGQVGVLTEQDVAGFNGRADVMSRLERLIETASKGKLPEGDRKFLTNYANTMQKAAKRNLLEAADLYKTQMSDDLGVSKDQAASLLNVEQRSDPKAFETVKVRLPNGKVGNIPKEKLEEAKKRGATEI